MKKLILILLALVATVSIASAQDAKKAPKAVFEKNVHDFGKVEESKGTVSTVFKFKNEGNAPFIIQRSVSSCGCTASDYTKEPILPGKEGNVTVTFTTTGRPGVINKSVTLFTNVPDSIYYLKIIGEVIRNK